MRIIAVLIGVSLMCYYIMQLIKMFPKRENKSLMRIENCISRLLKCVYEGYIEIPYEDLYRIEKIYLPHICKEEFKFLYLIYVKQIEDSLDFSYTFKTLKAGNDFRNSETRKLYYTFEERAHELYKQSILYDDLFDEELLKKYKKAKYNI